MLQASCKCGHPTRWPRAGTAARYDRFDYLQLGNWPADYLRETAQTSVAVRGIVLRINEYIDRRLSCARCRRAWSRLRHDGEDETVRTCKTYRGRRACRPASRIILLQQAMLASYVQRSNGAISSASSMKRCAVHFLEDKCMSVCAHLQRHSGDEIRMNIKTKLILVATAVSLLSTPVS